jgi:hypothetical protein
MFSDDLVHYVLSKAWFGLVYGVNATFNNISVIRDTKVVPSVKESRSFK